ncbi:geraniol 8-hydroxylase-like protein [Cinnamomum micranthum f. kanehirae]|uniref:Geraniol 8-hydroxylase-like protein n=1 Tax=Cinnamomum micranthum f. kanehirae TaxID=337451 RepID=A0A3S3PAF8_9MAGN|nr:geraniol 8-hydroxylase-like protein [Cinnamomum micranthum f. kanehirae]
MTVKRLDANIGLRRAKVQELVSHVRDCTVTKRAVDVGRAAFATTLNLMYNTLFSVDLVDLGSEEVQEFKDVVWGILEEAGRPNVSDYLPFLRWMDLQRVRRRSKGYIEKLYHLFDEMIDRRLRERSLGDYSRREDFLDVLLDHMEEEKGFQLKRHEIKALLVDIFVAGSDTSASTIEWAMAELRHNPDTMSMARSELKETVPKGKQLEESDIARLPYLQAVVKETLRLHPPAPLLIPHRAESTVEICGYIIPKDAQVIVNAWAIGRKPKCLDKPRFLLA